MAREQIEEQRSSNLSAVPYYDSFSGHREHLTRLVSARHRSESSQRLCVLGAGNAYDLDLPRLAALYREIHLVDIDDAALARARDRQDAATQARLVLHAPVDLSGLHDQLEAWRQFRVTPEELAAYPEVASNRIVDRLLGPFDVVVSACVLTQMQLAMLSALTSSHRLFEAVRQLLNVTHLRTLAKLLAPEGKAILATDLSSSALLPLSGVEVGSDLGPLMASAIAAGKIFYAAHPDLLQWMVGEDPILRRIARISPPLETWLWQNGAEKLFLVYALELTRVSG